ncbi:GMC oxidoreductase [Egicoccus halophilus]|uniref:GMC family oxidoreductase n=1 Tax=Egicoccus halophilus TaxID=1670830 RepID=A0A8J3AEB3_9ACTN|nr:GMC family oxidoreductase [Egicoccus halophilus]GGI06081.1 GMC family oxidoreductase [Egicoccus halophilus]
MIRDVDELPDDARLHAEVVVVGAGFAGIDLALRLAGDGHRVVLLESGRREFDSRIQELARFESVGREVRTPAPDSPFTPYLPPVFRGEFRVRQLGGTSNIWTGKWRAFDPLDLAPRPWVPHSGWPIGFDELLPYYAEVARDYGLGDFDAFAARPDVRRASERLDAAGLELSFHYWQQRPSRPGRDRVDELERAEQVEVVLGATATELVLDDAHRRVRSVAFAALDGRRFAVEADAVVLATGGLESARLLLASDRQVPGGIGNATGLVGRFHMDHPKSKHARLHPGPGMTLIEPWTRTDPKPRFHVSLALADEVQRDERTLDHAVYLSPVRTYQVDYPEREVAALREAVRARRPAAAVSAAWELLRRPGAVRKVLQRTRYREGTGPIAHYRASMYVEQAPNPDSRLRLAEERDELGVRRLVIDWQLDELDHASFRQVIASLSRRMTAAGIGTLDLGTDEPSLEEWVDAAHHIGATRMADDPAEGVVDRDTRVFGTDNLYVASSSVFPTGHSAAPTMTILALTRRLGDHLAARLADRAGG